MSPSRLIEHIYRGQKRKTGDPAVSHPYAVRSLLLGLGIQNKKTLEVALLHDVLEDSDLTKDYLQYKFGKHVADLVELLSKENIWNTAYCSMKSAMDAMETSYFDFPEAIMIKMADRLHNLQTLNGFSDKKQAEYLSETERVLMPVFRTCIQRTKIKQQRKVMTALLKMLNDILNQHTSKTT